ncbi:uncharacterized protein [Mytilus edulis]|uniref:uncharacterized protein n=1 Tax=Mytilus edulis TaxID=6550 RepID=UPI0039EDED86
MATSFLNCGVCNLRHISKLPTIWCTECDEGLCEGCKEHHSLSKGTRSHTVIPILEYNKLPSELVKISHYCNKHNGKYIIYCKTHECPCCISCIVQNHNKCDEIVKLDDVIHNAKTSNAFYEIEQTLVEVAENFKNIRQDRQKNQLTLSEIRKQIEKEIAETRIAINNYIDKIQADIIKKLCATEDKESRKIRQLLISLEEKQQEVSILQDSISDIKQHASDLQTFLSLKRIEKEVTGKNEFIRSISGNENLKKFVLSFRINTAIKNFISDIPNFGKILVESQQSSNELTTRKQKQAQMMVTKVPSRSFGNINLKLQQTINTKQVTNTLGTCMLPDGRMVFSSSRSRIGFITVLNANESLSFEVELPSLSFDVAYITENNTLAVSSGDAGARCIYIIDMQTQKINKTISIKNFIYGVTYNGSKNFYSRINRGIQMIKPNDDTINDIVRVEMPAYCYVTSFGNKLYHTNPDYNFVTCYDQQGKKQWIFQNNSVLQKPAGISVDNDGNVYVVCHNSNNLIIISPDGKKHRQLLSANDGLSDPRAIHFSKERNMLIVANTRGKAFIYSVN